MYSLSGSLNAKSYIPKEAGPQRTVGKILPNFWGKKAVCLSLGTVNLLAPAEHHNL